jgi:hypothetical protein
MNPRFSSIVEVHRGPRRWVYLPYAVILAAALLFGLADGQRLSGLWLYAELIPAFLVQLAWPTIAGWLITFAGCVGLWLNPFFIVILAPGTGVGILWLAVLAPGSLAPLYMFRPRISDRISER